MSEKITLGVRFIEKTEENSFISRSNKTYYYNFDNYSIDKLIGNICTIEGYSNYIIPVCQISFKANAKYLASEQIAPIARISSQNWSNEEVSLKTIELAIRLKEDFDDYIFLNGVDDERKIINYDLTSVNIDNKKENENMNMMPNMTFGPYNKRNVAISFYGLAVKNIETNRWFSYKGNESYDVTDFLINGMNNMVMAMPVAIKKITIGDIVLHNNNPMVVQEVNDNSLKAVDISNSEVKEIMPAKSPFGFNFCTKLISLFDGGMFDGDTDGDDDNIFGSMDPMMMMVMSGGFGSNSIGDSENPMANMMQTMFMMKAMKGIM